MKNNLDRLFREKLREREFDFQNAYWQQAERLLEEERHRLRLGYLRFAGSALGLLLLLIVGIWFFGKNEPPTVSTPRNFIAPKAGKTAESAAASTRQPGIKSQTSQASIATGPVESASFFTKNQFDGQNSAAVQAETGMKPVDVYNPIPELNGSPAVGGFAIDSEVLSGVSAAIADEADASAPGTPSSQESTPALAEEVILNRFDNLPQVSLYPAFVNSSHSLAMGQQGAGIRLRNWTFGFNAASHFQVDATGVQPIALRAGAVVRCRLGSNVFLATGTSYLRRTGTFEPTKRNALVAYSFGKSIDNSALKPSSLHYLAMPFTLGFYKNRHEVEGGIWLNYLLGVRGAIGREYIRHSPEPPYYLELIFQPEQQGWIVEEGFRKFFPELTLGYRYRFDRHLSAGAGVWFTPGTVLGHPEQALLRQADRWYFGLQGMYVF